MGSSRWIRILVVEDEGITAKALEEFLKDSGYEVVGIVSSGWEAVEQTAALQPDLVLMDIKLMGPMDGVSATQRIQSQLDVPVVYLTSYSDDETLKRVLHSQPYGYLIKPFDDQELRNAINKALYQHRLGQQDMKGTPI